MSSDPINPKHYKHLPVEAIDIIEAAIAKAPSNESAYLQGQVLKYLLRCWEKKGIEDLRKAKWYLDRMVSGFDDLLAEASGANETPSDEPSEETDRDDRPHDFKVGDAVISWQGREGVIEAIDLIEGFPITVRHSIRERVSYKLRGVKKKHDAHPVESTPWTPKAGERVILKATGAIYRIESYNEDSNQYSMQGWPGSCVNLESIAPWFETERTKRYREPTKDDLKNGPIACEYRDDCDEQWRSGFLVYILNGAVPFLCVNKEGLLSGQWAQCRIEVAE